MKFFIDKKKCVKCAACKFDCPVGAIEDFKINQEKCIQCGDCAEICPVGAISIRNEELEVRN